MRFKPLALTLALTLAATADSFADVPPPPPPPPGAQVAPVFVSPAEQAAIVDRIGDALAKEFHDPARVPAARAALKQALQRGQLPREGEAFAGAISEVLRTSLHDAHAHLAFSPEAIDPKALEAGPGGPSPADEMRYTNCGVRRADHYPGNVAYLRIDGMAPTAPCAATLASALQVVGQSDALIIDLRKNRGGSPEMVQWLASHFLPPETALSSMVSVREHANEGMRTQSGLPGPQLPSVPLYVLVSHDTFSAGEHFAYDLQQLHRARIVGQASGGGANPGAFRPVHAHFAVWVSLARSVSPITGGNWEGTGVQPDDVVADDAATRREAYKLALQALEARNVPSLEPGERAALLGDFDTVAKNLGL